MDVEASSIVAVEKPIVSASTCISQKARTIDGMPLLIDIGSKSVGFEAPPIGEIGHLRKPLIYRTLDGLFSDRWNVIADRQQAKPVGFVPTLVGFILNRLSSPHCSFDPGHCQPTPLFRHSHMNHRQYVGSSLKPATDVCGFVCPQRRRVGAQPRAVRGFRGDLDLRRARLVGCNAVRQSAVRSDRSRRI